MVCIAASQVALVVKNLPAIAGNILEAYNGNSNTTDSNISNSNGWLCKCLLCSRWAPQMALVVKNLPASAGDRRDEDLIPGLGRFPGEEYSSILA